MTDPEFLGETSDCDIFALPEIQSDKEISVTGFISIWQKTLKKLHKGPKLSGSIRIIVKEDVKHLIQLIPNEDSIWVKIKKFAVKKKDIFLGSFYVGPEGKRQMASLSSLQQ